MIDETVTLPRKLTDDDLLKALLSNSDYLVDEYCCITCHKCNNQSKVNIKLRLTTADIASIYDKIVEELEIK